ncbi:MAG: hypothetical protein R2741_08070 [Methanolobus sp.]
MHTNNNEILSFSTDATLTKLTADSICFDSESEQSVFNSLFISEKPSGHGIFKLELELPYISDQSDKHITLAIENAEKVIYLNGPLYFESSNIRTEENYKIINIDKPEDKINLIFITELAYGYLNFFVVISLFTFLLLILTILRRKIILKALKEKVPWYLERIPVRIYKSGRVEIRIVKINLPSIKREEEINNEDRNFNTIKLRIPKETIIGTGILVIAALMLKSVLHLFIAYTTAIGFLAYAIIGISLMAGFIIVLLLKTSENYSDTQSIALFIFGAVTLIILLNELEFMFTTLLFVATVITCVSKATIDSLLGKH